MYRLTIAVDNSELLSKWKSIGFLGEKNSCCSASHSLMQSSNMYVRSYLYAHVRLRQRQHSTQQAAEGSSSNDDDDDSQFKSLATLATQQRRRRRQRQQRGLACCCCFVANFVQLAQAAAAAGPATQSQCCLLGPLYTAAGWQLRNDCYTLADYERTSRCLVTAKLAPCSVWCRKTARSLGQQQQALKNLEGTSDCTAPGSKRHRTRLPAIK
jgi:hypothetical protein